MTCVVLLVKMILFEDIKCFSETLNLINRILAVNRECTIVKICVVRTEILNNFFIIY